MKRCFSSGNVYDNHDNDHNDDPFISIISKKARKQKKTSVSASQSSSAKNIHVQSSSTMYNEDSGVNATQTTTSRIDLDAIINSVAHTSYVAPHQEINSDSTALAQIVELRSIVKLLADQVSFLLSYVGVTEANPSTVISQHPTIAVSSQIPLKSYSDVAKQPAPALQQSFKEAVVAAVYVDQSKKTGQAANIVITGLPIHQTTSDKTTVTTMLANELNLQVYIVKCKRLGKAVSGRPQPLLAILRTVEEADRIMANAKRLRNSVHTYVRDNVFINRHLTPAQARAAYDIRCQRRQVAQQRSSRQPPLSSSSSVLPLPTSSSSASSSSSTNQHSYGSISVPNSQLNATVPAFLPTSSTSPPLPLVPPCGSTIAMKPHSAVDNTVLDCVVPPDFSSQLSASIPSHS